MNHVIRYMINLSNNYKKNEYRNRELNKYCNCKSVKYFIEDYDGYGEWIICIKCKKWCGWYYNCEYYNREGIKI